MSFEFNPAEEDPHGECRHEIHRLEAAMAKAEADHQSLARIYECNEKLAWECVDLIAPGERGSNPLLILRRLLQKRISRVIYIGEER